jgi:hypothetical protein
MKIHFIGIGGIGVSSLAQYYLSQGAKVSGSDLARSEITDLLENKGANLFIGENRKENISKDLDLVIFSPAVSENNPEFEQAKKYGIEALSYPQALGRLSKDYFTIAVSDGILDDADVVEYLIVNRSYDANTQSNSGVTILNEIGTGTAAQLVILEKDLSTRDGNTRSPLEGSYMWSATSSVVTAETYVVYALEFYRPQDNILVRENNPKQVLYVACPTSETGDNKDIYETDLILADAIS